MVCTKAANDPSVFTITEKAPSFQTLVKHYAKHLNMTSSRGLLRDCENRWIVCSSNVDFILLVAGLLQGAGLPGEGVRVLAHPPPRPLLQVLPQEAVRVGVRVGGVKPQQQRGDTRH